MCGHARADGSIRFDRRSPARGREDDRRMNFFENQDRARRSTTRLVILFVLAVIGIVGAMNLATFGLLRAVQTYSDVRRELKSSTSARDRWDSRQSPSAAMNRTLLWQRPEVYGGVTVVTLLIIGGGSAYKTLSLSGGGRSVAEMMGGRLLDPQAADQQEHVLQNVVEEMSIASGVPVPALYILDSEPGINAFAAGFTPQDAIIGVTRGAVTKLTRDELQGVIAHEFSHILNGDMRLNLRLIGTLHGILLIGLIGYGILRGIGNARWSSSRDDKGGGIAVLLLALAAGLALLIIGYVGFFFGRLIQAAVSRQREFLADASAVQFTRNPTGLENALRKLGDSSSGSRIRDPRAPELAHMFFASGLWNLTDLLATHPPLEQRIRAIDPNWDGTFTPVRDEGRPTLVERYDGSWVPGAARGEPQFAFIRDAARGSSRPPPLPMAVSPQELVRRIGAPTPQHLTYAAMLIDAIPRPIAAAAREPFGARATLFCLLLSNDPSDRARQMQMLQQQTDPTTLRLTAELAPAIAALGAPARLALFELAMPALRQIAATQLAEFKQALKALIEADAQVTPFEFILFRLVGKMLVLPGAPVRRPEVRYAALKPVMGDVVAVLSLLARAGCGGNPSRASMAYRVGIARLGVDVEPPMRDNVSLQELDAALGRLVTCAPGVKRRIVDACAHCVASDGVVCVEEAELLRLVTAMLDCPLPPFLEAVAPNASAGDLVAGGAVASP
jgi:Zn-dependent protease with chaperone function